MRIDVLTIPDCPNGPLALERVRLAVDGAEAVDAGDVTVEVTLVTGTDDAAVQMMHGSPTILIDGRDPFAEPGTTASMSCRLYRTSIGTQGCPTVADLIEAINVG